MREKNKWKNITGNHIQDHRWLYIEMVSKENTRCDLEKNSNQTFASSALNTISEVIVRLREE